MSPGTTQHCRTTLGILLCIALAGNAGAAELAVQAGGAFSSIQAALDAAAEGDTIIVAPGSYQGNLRISKPVTLAGTGLPRIIGDGNSDAVLILASNVKLTGFAISDSGNDMMHSDAGIRIEGDSAQVAGNVLSDNLFGVYFSGCEQALVEGNTITGHAELTTGSRGAGMHLYDAHRNTIRGNNVSFVRDGCYFDHSDFNLVEDNVFHNLRYGVHYMFCDDNSFYRNTFRDSVAGVAVMYTQRVNFSDNRILNNRKGYHAFGLLFKEAEDCIAERNVIVNNVSGMFIEGSHNNTFRDNLVAYNDVGVKLYASSLGNSFEGNDFIGNLAMLHTVGRAVADWAPDGRGNYYSNYEGYDLDRDGLGDIPHRLQDAFEYLEGSRPVLRLYLSSAAADALAIAEKAFPLIPGSDQTDPAPAIRPVSGMLIGTGELDRLTAGTAWSLLAVMVVLLASVGLAWRLAR